MSADRGVMGSDRDSLHGGTHLRAPRTPLRSRHGQVARHERDAELGHDRTDPQGSSCQVRREEHAVDSIRLKWVPLQRADPATSRFFRMNYKLEEGII